MRRFNLSRIRTFIRRDGKEIMVPTRRDMSRTSPPPGVRTFTLAANQRALAARRAKNKQARSSRKRNRV